jgi:sterol desaturase/sphingolipid hydroxylase (fatty acid hydroxylase superfamily)
MPTTRSNAGNIPHTAKDWLLGLAAAAAVGFPAVALMTAVLPRVWPSGVEFAPWAGLLAVMLAFTAVHLNRRRRRLQ